jgi:hypothetical protein
MRNALLFVAAALIALFFSVAAPKNVAAQGGIEGWITYLTSQGGEVSWDSTLDTPGGCNFKIWIPNEKTELIAELAGQGWTKTAPWLTTGKPGYTLMDTLFKGLPCPPPPPALSSESQPESPKNGNLGSEFALAPISPQGILAFCCVLLVVAVLFLKKFGLLPI